MMNSNGPAGNSGARRMSPVTNSISAACSRGKFSSEPRRYKLSMHTTRVRGKLFFRCSARLLPTKPAPPVIKMLSGGFISRDARGVDFRQNFLQAVSEFPVGIMRLEFPHIADPPDVVADAIVLDVSPFQFFAADAFAFVNRLEHGTIRVAAAAGVIDFAGSR